MADDHDLKRSLDDLEVSLRDGSPTLQQLDQAAAELSVIGTEITKRLEAAHVQSADDTDSTNAA